MNLLTVHKAAQLLDTTPEVLYCARWRRRVGLPVVRIGRAIRFRAEDLHALIERGREQLLEAESRSD